MRKQARLYIKGEVIGVGFRSWINHQTKLTNIKGWVRNVGNEVEVLLQGEEKDIKEMIKRIKKGPPISNVDAIETTWEKPNPIHSSFEILK
ncbi:MAG: acylphosphatase [bacterium]